MLTTPGKPLFLLAAGSPIHDMAFEPTIRRRNNIIVGIIGEAPCIIEESVHVGGAVHATED